MTKNLSLIAVILLVLSSSVSAQLSVQHLLTENLKNPIGLDSKLPRFSWQLEAADRNELQTAYEIRVSKGSNGKESLWSSGKVASSQYRHLVYSGPGLQSGKKYYWQVRIWDNKGRVSPWSASAWWQTGLFETTDWTAKWIQPGYTEDSILRPSPLFRKEFAASKKILSATAYITAHGLYEARINGERVGDAWLTPGWTAYQKRLQYQTYDVTALVRKGKNAIGVTLGSGWYRGYLAFERQHNT